jgi:starch-binding outer membrane protein, SusD/RagB family
MKMIKKIKMIKVTVLSAAVIFASCTNLDVKEKDSLVIETAEGSFAGVDPAAALSTGYADLRGFANQENLYALTEVTSDELLVPTRGTDWGDNGIWRTLHQHTWDPSHQYILNTWNNLNSNVFRLNQLLAPESNPSASQTAEGKFLRGYNMYLLLDLFRQVPFREVDEGVDVNPRVLTPQEVFDFIDTDLMDAMDNLPATGPNTPVLIKASQAAAHFLLAKLYLNKHIYLGGEPQTADMNKVIQHVDAINAAGFKLQSGYFEIFKPSTDSETILWTDASIGNRIWNGLHYNQQTPDNTGGGWNGFSTTAEFYSLFEGDPESNEPGKNQEERRGFVALNNAQAEYGLGYGFLVGQQYGANGQPLEDRAGNPLVYTKDFPGLAGNNERTGIRVLKYHPTVEGGSFTNHYILFRYADAHLMKVEAILRGGTASSGALALYNELRAVRNASPAASIELMDILDERGRELYIEGWRRNDQIRFGTFTQPFALKESTEEFRILFPVPANALSSNPNLVQNPGY